ncbi:acylphosphatase [Candidatus Kaiserbacteria bacterium]|nr:acylphosphatase [Candidatus Kaiserbacteria bacterium]
MNDVEEIRCIVKGKVQGVFYRDFVAKHARHLALTGFVRNTPNFTVEIVAQGYRDKLEKFLEHARKGPFLARVSDLGVEWREPSQDFDSFEVVF